MFDQKEYCKKYYIEHKAALDERNREYMKSYCKTKTFKKNQALWRKENREKVNKCQQSWRERNREKVNEYARNDARTEKGKMRDKAQHHNRRIRAKGLTVGIIQKVYEENIKKYGTLTCELCLAKINFGDDHLEHFTPLSRGGSNAPDNLGIAHSTCNKRKGSKTLSEYHAWI